MADIEEKLEALVLTIEREWRAAENNEDAFPDIAARALASEAPWVGKDVAATLEWAATRGTRKPTERDVDVAGIPLAQSSRFEVSLRVATDELPVRSARPWVGAAQVLTESVHSVFAFTPAMQLDPKFALGSAKRTHNAVLAAGATIALGTGADSIHQLGHTDRVGLTVFVRTTERLGAASAELLPPGVLVDPDHKDAAVARRLRCLDALVTVDPKMAQAALVAALREDDPRTSFHLLRHAAMELASTVDWRGLWDAGQRRFGKHAAIVERALTELERRARIASGLKRAKHRDDRLVLLLLDTACSEADFEALVANAFPDRPPPPSARDVLDALGVPGM